MSHLWRKLKKGFTAVELAIVIAVIGILIAVIVPTFIGILNNARKSNDSTLVYNANQTLQIEETLTGKSYDNVTEAITTLVENGYTVESLTATADDCTLAYDTSTNSFVVLESYSAEGVSASNVCIINPDSTTLSEAYSNSITNFCYYDLGENVTIDIDSAITNVNSQDEITVTVYTSDNASVEITSTNATVEQYGTSGDVTIYKVAQNSYHVHGYINGTLTLNEGHVVFYEGSDTETLKIGGSNTKITYIKGATVGEIVCGSCTPSAITIKESEDDTGTPVDCTSTATIAAGLYKYISYRSGATEATITLVKNNGENSEEITLNDSNSWIISSYSGVTYANFHFDGWYTNYTKDDEGTETFDGLFSSYADLSDYNSTAIKSDLTLYAKWIPEYTVNYYYVYFKGDNATISQSAAITTTVVSGECANQPSDPEVTGYTFVGWYSDESCTSEYNFSEVVESGIELYAKLTLNIFTVNFYNAYSYDGSETAVQTLTIYYGYTIAASDVFNYFTETSYAPYYPASNEVTEGSKTFGGWYTDKDFTSGKEFTFGSTTVTENLSVYAYWADVYLTVTLNLNNTTISDYAPAGYTANGNGIYTIKDKVAYGSTLTSFTDPTVSGSTFTGWYTDSELITKFVFGSDDNATKVTANITLYAGWDVDTTTINGVVYTKVDASNISSYYSSSYVTATNDNGTYTITYANSNVTATTTTGYYWVITGYTNDISAYYKTGSWLILENEINGSPVLEIGAGALGIANDNYGSTESSYGYFATLKNVLVPENIVMVGSRAFLDNKCIESIVFLAKEVYFSNNVNESYNKNYCSNISKDSGGTTSKDFPFYGCGTDKDNSSTKLTVYYRTAYSTSPADNSTLNNGVFIVNRKGSNNGDYLRTKNDSSTSSSSSLKTITWLYVNTSSITQTLTCGEYERGDFDWASAIVDAFSDCGVACCSYNGHVFVGGSLDGISSAFAANIKTIINSFTAEYGEYINGYEVSAAAGTSLVNGNDVTFTVTTETTPYYLLNVSQSVVATDETTAISSAEWTIVSGSNSDSNNTATVTYSAKIGENSTAVTVTVTYSGSNVEYFDYSNSSYSTYYSTSDSGAGVYGTGSVTISGTSGYNYELYNVGDMELTEDVTSAEVTANSDKTTDVALVWEQTDDPYIYIISGVEFTYCDGTNTTTIYASEDGTSGSPLRYNSVNSGSNTDDDNNNILYTATATTDSKAGVATSASNYYFLGWAYMAGADEDGTGGTLTFTNIAATEATFEKAGTYYAIWAYSKLELTECLGTANSYALNNPTVTSGTFVRWCTDSSLSRESAVTDLTNDCYTYYAKVAQNEVTKNGVVYKFKDTTATSVSLGSTSNEKYYVTADDIDGGYYVVKGTTDGYDAYCAIGAWLVLENEINSYKVIEIEPGAFKNTNGDSSRSIENSLSNIIVPSNVIMIGSQAFTDNLGLTNVVFLADTIFFSFNSSESTYDDNNIKSPSSGRSEYLAFYGCTTTSSNTETYLNVYYKNAYTSSDSGLSTLDSNTFYLRASGSTHLSDSNIHAGGTWLYIDTTVSNLVGGSYSIDGYSADDIQSDIIEALQKFAGSDNYYTFTGYSNEGYILISYCLTSENTVDDVTYTLQNYIATYVTACIDSYTASALSYINGHTVSVTEDTKTVGETTVSLYDLTVTVSDCETDGTFTAYYKISEENLLGTTTEGETTYSSWSTSTISYSEVTTSESTDSVTVTYTLSDGTTLYATYSATAGSFEIYNSVLYIKNGTALTVTANNSEYKVDSITYDGTAGTDNNAASGQSYSVTTAASAGTLTISWSAVTFTAPVTIYTDVAFTLGSTSIAEGTTTVELGSDSATLDGLAVNGAPDYYYFLGWAYDNSGTLTFTSSITTKEDTTYYAIWGYNKVTKLSGSHGSSDSDTASFPTVTGANNETVYKWYTKEGFDSSYVASALTSGTYTYYARMSFVLTLEFYGSNTTVTINGTDGSTRTASTNDGSKTNKNFYAYLDILEGDTLKVTTTNSYKTLTIYDGSITYTGTGKQYSGSNDRTFGKDSSHYAVITYTNGDTSSNIYEQEIILDTMTITGDMKIYFAL